MSTTGIATASSSTYLADAGSASPTVAERAEFPAPRQASPLLPPSVSEQRNPREVARVGPTPPEPPASRGAWRIGGFPRATFGPILTGYHEEPDGAALTVAALEALRRFAPELEIEVTGESGRRRVTARLLGETLINNRTLPRPQRDDEGYWQVKMEREFRDRIGAVLDGIYRLIPEVRAVSRNEIFAAIATDMGATLDRHSGYIEPARFADMESRRSATSYVGFGFTHETRDDGILIQEVYADSPAGRAGLAAGSLIVALDGHPTAGLSSEEASARIREAREFTLAGVETPLILERGEVTFAPIESTFADGIATIRLRTFTPETYEEMTALAEMLRDTHGDEREGIIIDLRRNGGGTRLDTVQTVQDTATQGEIFSSRGRHFNANLSPRYATAHDMFDGLPIAVLVDEGSASASEILAMGLAYSGRAVIVGSRTYGKGSVQRQHSLEDGGRFSVTVARYFGAGGVSVDRRGLVPHVCLAGEEPVTLSGTVDLHRMHLAATDDADGDADARYQELCDQRALYGDEAWSVAAALIRDPVAYASALTPMDGIEGLPIADDVESGF